MCTCAGVRQHVLLSVCINGLGVRFSHMRITRACLVHVLRFWETLENTTVLQSHMRHVFKICAMYLLDRSSVRNDISASPLIAKLPQAAAY